MLTAGRVLRLIGWLSLSSLWIVAIVPLACWIGMVFNASWFWLHLGRWPHYNNPDPGSPDLPPVLRTPWPSLSATAVALVVLTVIAVWKTKAYAPKRRVLVAVAAIVVLWAGGYLLARFDPGGIVEWYFD